MPEQYHNDPLHGMTLQKILEALVDKFGWKSLSRMVEIRCFYNDPSIKSSLKFLRKTEWARKKVEDLYVKHCVKGIVENKSQNCQKNAVEKEPSESETPWFERRRLKKRK